MLSGFVDSTGIIAVLERRWPDPPPYPADEMKRERALELEDFFDEHAGHEMRRAGFWEIRDDPGTVIALLATPSRPTDGVDAPTDAPRIRGGVAACEEGWRSRRRSRRARAVRTSVGGYN